MVMRTSEPAWSIGSSNLPERFTLLEQLKRGHLTDVYLVKDRETRQEAVLKVPRQGDTEDSSASLRTEARALSHLRSERMVRLLEDGTNNHRCSPSVLDVWHRGIHVSRMHPRTCARHFWRCSERI